MQKTKKVTGKFTGKKAVKSGFPAKRIYSIELIIIKAFIALDGKTVEQDKIANQWHKVKQALKKKEISAHRSMILEISSKLHNALGHALVSPENKIKINLEPEFKKKCQDAVKGAQVKVRTEYLAGTGKVKSQKKKASKKGN